MSQNKEIQPSSGRRLPLPVLWRWSPEPNRSFNTVRNFPKSLILQDTDPKNYAAQEHLILGIAVRAYAKLTITLGSELNEWTG